MLKILKIEGGEKTEDISQITINLGLSMIWTPVFRLPAAVIFYAEWNNRTPK